MTLIMNRIPLCAIFLMHILISGDCLDKIQHIRGLACLRSSELPYPEVTICMSSIFLRSLANHIRRNTFTCQDPNPGVACGYIFESWIEQSSGAGAGRRWRKWESRSRLDPYAFSLAAKPKAASGSQCCAQCKFLLWEFSYRGANMHSRGTSAIHVQPRFEVREVGGTRRGPGI
jgi:hypothetical protein